MLYLYVALQGTFHKITPFSCQKWPKITKTTLKSLSHLLTVTLSGWPCPSICPHFPSPTGPKLGSCLPHLKAAVIVQQNSQTRRTRAQTVTGVEDTMVMSTSCTFGTFVLSCLLGSSSFFFKYIFYHINLFQTYFPYFLNTFLYFIHFNL